MNPRPPATLSTAELREEVDGRVIATDYAADVKRRYDPTNVFHLSQNVPPAADG